MIPRWHDGSLSKLARDGAPVIWSVATGSAAATEALASSRADAADLADAAQVRDSGWRLARHCLARVLIARMAGVHPATVCLERTAAGVPRVRSPEGWYLSISGRGNEALIGVAVEPLGVDRETIDGNPPIWDMLTGAEARTLRNLPSADQPLDWLRRWTIKEAHAKLIGEPRRIRPEWIETSLYKAAYATASFEGTSHCWTRRTRDAFETVAVFSRDPGLAA